MNIEQLYKSMLELDIAVKLLHFQTTSYDIHKITDAFLLTYRTLFDAFWEVFQTNKFRISFKTSIPMQLNNVRSLKDLEPITAKVAKLLQ